MSKTIALWAFLLLLATGSSAQEYLIMTTVESIVPAGIGRSRIILQKTPINSTDFTTQRTDGKSSDQGDIKRGDAKIDSFEETKLLNFYSMVGINFQNIASNDALITDKINKLAKEGWKLIMMTSGVESDAGETDGNGIFITRYLFQKG